MRVTRPLERAVCVAALVSACVVVAAGPASGQASVPGATRRSTTVEALITYPAFFHLQPVRVRGDLRLRDRDVLLAANAREVRLAGAAATGAATGQDAAVEVTGVFLDPGRLEPGDPRLRDLDVAALSQRLTGKPWPGVDELLVLMADRVEAAAGLTGTSLRAIALSPERFEEQTLTVTGRFRGRNLYGDQPTAPGRSRYDFVLQSGEGSLWVTGLRPRGDGFTLDIDSRVDTGRWLEVTGVLRAARGLVYLEATSLKPAKAPEPGPPSEPVARIDVTGPPPDVVFSVPTQDEGDVSGTAVVRIQFSRDVDKDSLKGRVRVTYVPQPTAAGGPPLAIEFTATYVEASRVLEIRFKQPLERFRGVQVELLEGITGTDRAAAKPWTLKFTTGG